MESIQISGKHFSALQLRRFLRRVANSIPTEADIIGSVDTTNPYETLISFSIGEGRLNLALFDMKGGVA